MRNSRTNRNVICIIIILTLVLTVKLLQNAKVGGVSENIQDICYKIDTECEGSYGHFSTRYHFLDTL